MTDEVDEETKRSMNVMQMLPLWERAACLPKKKTTQKRRKQRGCPFGLGKGHLDFNGELTLALVFGFRAPFFRTRWRHAEGSCRRDAGARDEGIRDFLIANKFCQ